MAAAPAGAHPLGEDTVSHFSVLHLHRDRLEIDLVLEIAEYPSAAIYRDEVDADRDGIDSPAEQRQWLDRKAVEWAPLLKVAIDGQPVSLSPIEHLVDEETGREIGASRLMQRLPGVAGLPTYRVIIRYQGTYPALPGGEPRTLTYEDNTFPGQRGLMRILLERTSLVRQLPRPDEAILAELAERTIPQRVREALAQGESPLSDEASLTVETDARAWLLRDGTRRYRLEAERGGLAIHRLPRVAVIPPRPDYWDECPLDPFIFEQYDQGNMPYERETTFRFHLEGAEVESPPAEAMAATQPSTENIAAILARLNDPRNDPARRSTYQKEADRLIGLLQGPGGLWAFLAITGLAFGYGAVHALMPGHAKTLVAAYLISQRGTWWHAVVLAAVVTVTHTALVVILGLVIWACQATRPDLGPKLQLWLGAIAGLLVAGMGLVLGWRAVTGRTAHHHHEHEHPPHGRRSWLRMLFTHSHPHPVAPAGGHSHTHEPPLPHAHPHTHDHGHTHHDHGHAHHDHGHDHVHPRHHHDHNDHHHEHGPLATHHHHHPQPAAEGDRVTVRLLVLMGITGGIVPCPTAMIIMLLGIGANVVAGALYAVGIFSLGLALTLMAIGFLALGSRRFATRLLADTTADAGQERLTGRGRWLMLQLLPAFSGLVVFALGSAIAAHYLYYLCTGSILFTWIQ